MSGARTGDQGAFRLGGKLAVVTGGGTGLGLAAARALAAHGAQVVLLGRRAAVLARAAAGIGASARTCDVASEEQVASTFADIAGEHGPVEILVNAHGISMRGDILDYPAEHWDQTHKTNVRGAFLTSVAAARQMRDNGGGKIINYCSYGSARGLPRSVAYSASKGALRLMTQSMAIELAPANIQVNAIEPGWFVTDMTADLYEDEAWLARVKARIPAGRIGKAEDIDGALLYLASPLSDYVSGIMIPVDGGAQAV